MSSDLVLIDSETASNSASVSLLGMTSDFNIYVAMIDNVQHSATSYDYVRFTVSESADISANYDSAMKVIRTAGAYFNGSYSNATFAYLSPYTKSTTAQDQTNAIFYIFQSQNSSDYTFATMEETSKGTSLFGSQGFMVLKENQITDGINFSPSTGNYTSGNFKLYGLKNS